MNVNAHHADVIFKIFGFPEQEQFFDKLGEMLGFERVSEYAHKFGLGEKAGWNIPGESPGKFPEEPPKEGVGILSAYGQGIEVTPLQLAAQSAGARSVTYTGIIRRSSMSTPAF